MVSEYALPLPQYTADEFVLPPEPWREASATWSIPADLVPLWWDGQTEVPEGYVWPWEAAELQAKAAAEAFEFTEEMAAAVAGALHAVGGEPL